MQARGCAHPSQQERGRAPGRPQRGQGTGGAGTLRVYEERVLGPLGREGLPAGGRGGPESSEGPCPREWQGREGGIPRRTRSQKRTKQDRVQQNQVETGSVLVTFKQKSNFSFFTRKTEPAVGQLLTGSLLSSLVPAPPQRLLRSGPANMETPCPTWPPSPSPSCPCPGQR